MQWRRGFSRRDLCAAEMAGEGAFQANGKSIVMRLLPAAEEFRRAGFFVLVCCKSEVSDVDRDRIDWREDL